MYKWICLGEKMFCSFKYRWLAQQLQYSIPKELDFMEEVKNAKRAKEMLKELKSVKVPDVYEEHSNVRWVCG